MTDAANTGPPPAWNPFPGDPAAWQAARERARDLLQTVEPHDQEVRDAVAGVYEHTCWGWLRWDTRLDGAQRPRQIGLLPPRPSRRAGFARRQLTRRLGPFIRLTERPVPAWQFIGVSGVAMGGLTALGSAPAPVIAAVTTAAGAAVWHAPAAATAYARRHVQFLDGPPEQFLRLVSLHVRMTTLGAGSDLPELHGTLRLGHQMLWDTAALLEEPHRHERVHHAMQEYEHSYTALLRSAAEALASRTALEEAAEPPLAPTPEVTRAATDGLLPPAVLDEAAATLAELSVAYEHARQRLHELDQPSPAGSGEGGFS